MSIKSHRNAISISFHFHVITHTKEHFEETDTHHHPLDNHMFRLHHSLIAFIPGLQVVTMSMPRTPDILGPKSEFKEEPYTDK